MRKVSRRSRRRPAHTRSMKPRRRLLDAESEDDEDEVEIGAGCGAKDETGET